MTRRTWVLAARVFLVGFGLSVGTMGLVGCSGGDAEPTPEGAVSEVEYVQEQGAANDAAAAAAAAARRKGQ